MMWRRALGGVAALLVLLAVMVAVPLALWRTVGNPWPGWDRVQLGDERNMVSGVLAAVAWLVWARFVVAVVAEVYLQVRMALAAQVRTHGPVEVAMPPVSRTGVGLVAQRLVAAVLVLLPFLLRAAPALAEPPPPLSAGPAAATMSIPETASPLSGAAGGRTRVLATVASHELSTVVVQPGDTLIGLARTHLGDGSRWREIFELNRDRQQPGGGRLTTPGVLLAGWTLQLPAPDVAGQPSHDDEPFVPGGPVAVERGATLWDLAHERLEAAGAAHDDANVVVYLDAVLAANAAVVVDPDVLAVGQVVELPSIGTPPPVVSASPVVPPPVVTVSPVVPAPPVAEAPPATATLDDGPATTVAAVATTAAPVTAAAATTSTVESTTTTHPANGDDLVPGGELSAGDDDGSPSPIGLGEAALLSAGVLALLLARRRMRLRSSLPRTRVPEPAPEQVATERTVRSIDGAERVLRMDVAVRAAAATLLGSHARIAIVCVSADGTVELTLTAEATLTAPWSGARGRWILTGAVPIEELAEVARSVGAPCVALIQLGVDDYGREVFVDLEALGLLAVDAAPDRADAVVRAMAATLGTSVFSEIANLVAVGLEPDAFLDHRSGHHLDDLGEAIGLATKLVGTTATARTSTFDLRARHTSGESWEPAVVLGASSVTHHMTPELVRRAARRRGGLAVVVAGAVDGAPWTLKAAAGAWVLEPLGLRVTPVALSAAGLTQVADLLRAADTPLIDDEPRAEEPAAAANRRPSRRAPRRTDVHVVPDTDTDGGDDALVGDAEADPSETVGLVSVPDARDEGDGARPIEPPWAVLVRVLGPVEVVDRDLQAVRFGKSKSLELVAWLALHRERPTRTGARSALWDLDVRDATFANVVSQARRAMARHVAPPLGDEWLGRTLTERLPLHPLVVTDADLVRARLGHAGRQPREQAIVTLRPAVELIRDLPFAGTGYLWPDPEGIASNLVLLATSAATELAEHHLALGDVDGVFWATGQGLKMLPAHEELIALRMRAHARTGDLSGVRLEWECYERVLDADRWGAGEPAQKLVLLRQELLAS